MRHSNGLLFQWGGYVSLIDWKHAALVIHLYVSSYECRQLCAMDVCIEKSACLSSSKCSVHSNLARPQKQDRGPAVGWLNLCTRSPAVRMHCPDLLLVAALAVTVITMSQPEKWVGL